MKSSIYYRAQNLSYYDLMNAIFLSCFILYISYLVMVTWWTIFSIILVLFFIYDEVAKQMSHLILSEDNIEYVNWSFFNKKILYINYDEIAEMKFYQGGGYYGSSPQIVIRYKQNETIHKIKVRREYKLPEKNLFEKLDSLDIEYEIIGLTS